MPAAAGACGRAVTVRPPGLRPALPAGIAVTAAFREPAGARVVLEAAMAFVRLTNCKLRRRPGHSLALDTWQLRSNQRPMQANFFGRHRRIAVVTMNRRVLMRLDIIWRSGWFRFF